MLNQVEALKAARKTRVGGIAHIGEFCVVKYGKANYWIYPSGKLFHTGASIGNGDLAVCVRKVFETARADQLPVVVDNG